MKKKILIIVTILVHSFFLKAQPPVGGGAGKGQYMNSELGIVVGNVFDKGLLVPVEYANIILYKQADSTLVTGAVTDATGKFFIKEVPYDTYYLIANFIGYNKFIINDIKISSDSKFFKIDTIFLEQATQELAEVGITATKDYIKYEIDKKIVNVSQNPSASGGSAADALLNTPSVSVDIEGTVSLRGSSNFKVLIDGKPTTLDPNDVLQQTPASMIENIEIITNPSAKYDPDGTSGIINIVMKEDVETGLNGIVNASFKTMDKYSADFLFNYRTKKINFFFGADYSDAPRNSETLTQREDYKNDTIRYIYSEGFRGHAHGGYSAKGGFDLYLNDFNTISFSANAGDFIFGRSSSFNYTYWTNPETVKTYFISAGSNDIKTRYYTGDVTYLLQLPKDELTLYGYYAYKNGSTLETQKDTYTDLNWTDLGIDKIEHKSVNDAIRTEVKFKADYTKTITESTKLEAGYNGQISLADFNYLYQDFDNISQTWISNSTYSNISEYSNLIQAAYATFSSEISTYSFMAGLRGEYTKRIFTQKTMNQEYPFEKFSFFPSAYITKTFEREQQLQLNYSRRINRPEEWFLNPFPMYSDQYSVMVGNPALEPEYTNSYELNYQKTIGTSFVSLETFYRKTNNTMSRVSELQSDGRLLTQFRNINNETNYGAELMGNFTLFKIILLNPSLSVYRYQVMGEVDDISKIEKSLNYNGMLSALIFVGKTTKVQIMGMYDSPSATLQGTKQGSAGIGLTVKQQFFGKKLTVSVGTRDLFGSMKWEFTSAGDGYSVYNLFSPEYPVINFSISYKINKYTEKKFDSEGGDMNIDSSF